MFDASLQVVSEVKTTCNSKTSCSILHGSSIKTQFVLLFDLFMGFANVDEAQTVFSTVDIAVTVVDVLVTCWCC